MLAYKNKLSKNPSSFLMTFWLLLDIPNYCILKSHYIVKIWNDIILTTNIEDIHDSLRSVVRCTRFMGWEQHW